MSDQERKQPTCGDCMYFTKSELNQGRCRRFPPQVVLIPVKQRSMQIVGPQEAQAVSFQIKPEYPPVGVKYPACAEYRPVPEEFREEFGLKGSEEDG